MDIGLLILRLVVGVLFVGHGSQKLFGAFGGHGLKGTGQFMESLGIRPGHRAALAAGLAEFAGGVLLVLGLLTPLAAMLITATMVTAIWTVHAAKGPWATEGGYEYNVTIAAAVFAVAAIGAGAASADHVLGLHIAGAGWALVAFGLGLIGGSLPALSARRRPRTRATPAGRAHTTAA
jgi:putative oxidoreductase